ncbi:MAG: FtsX-like permease family protein [Bacteroidota bacterium]
MNLPFFIARRYFLSKKKKNFINIISLISMIVVAIGTACLIVALSVFNGLGGLLRTMYGNFDPDMIITPVQGKSFHHADSTMTKMEKLKGVIAVSEVIEDDVLLRYKQSQRVVRLKGVSRAFDKYSGIKNVIVAGQFPLVEDSIGYALIGRGVQYDLSINLQDDFYTLQIYYPKNIGPRVVDPEKMYNVLNISPGGVFAIEKYYDENYVFVPVEFARKLLNYENKLTSYEVYLDPSADEMEVKKKISLLIGDKFAIKSGEELHSALFKVLEIEKLFVFLTLTSIIAIASINIFFSLTMLVIEKKKDISVLLSQGASHRLIRMIFIFEGCIVAFTGAGLGLLLGLGISWVQQEFGIVGMGMQSSVVANYPIKVELMDVFITVFAIIIITILASIQPALKASNSFSIKTL